MEPEYHIRVHDIVKTPTPSGRHSEEEGSPAGDTIRKLIEAHWDTHEKIMIFFSGIVKMSRVFVDEAFAMVLEKHTLEEYNKKMYFPDASDRFTKELNSAVKLRLKIIQSQRDRQSG